MSTAETEIPPQETPSERMQRDMAGRRAAAAAAAEDPNLAAFQRMQTAIHQRSAPPPAAPAGRRPLAPRPPSMAGRRQPLAHAQPVPADDDGVTTLVPMRATPPGQARGAPEPIATLAPMQAQPPASRRPLARQPARPPEPPPSEPDKGWGWRTLGRHGGQVVEAVGNYARGVQERGGAAHVADGLIPRAPRMNYLARLFGFDPPEVEPQRLFNHVAIRPGFDTPNARRLADETGFRTPNPIMRGAERMAAQGRRIQERNPVSQRSQQLSEDHRLGRFANPQWMAEVGGPAALQFLEQVAIARLSGGGVGAFVATAVPMEYGSAMGDIERDLLEQGVAADEARRRASRAAEGYALVSGALEALPGKFVVDDAGRALLPRILLGYVTEGGTEAMQTAAQAVANYSATGDSSAFDGLANDMLESGYLGGLIGGSVAGVSGARPQRAAPATGTPDNVAPSAALPAAAQAPVGPTAAPGVGTPTDRQVPGAPAGVAEPPVRRSPGQSPAEAAAEVPGEQVVRAEEGTPLHAESWDKGFRAGAMDFAPAEPSGMTAGLDPEVYGSGYRAGYTYRKEQQARQQAEAQRIAALRAELVAGEARGQEAGVGAAADVTEPETAALSVEPAPAAVEPIWTGRRRGVDPVANPGTYYHVAAEDYSPGEPIKSFFRLMEEGREPKWKWEFDWTDGGYIDGTRVALHDNLQEAQEFQREYGGTILQVDVPPESGLRGGVLDEGYPFIEGEIPADMIAGAVLPVPATPAAGPAPPQVQLGREAEVFAPDPAGAPVPARENSGAERADLVSEPTRGDEVDIDAVFGEAPAAAFLAGLEDAPPAPARSSERVGHADMPLPSGVPANVYTTVRESARALTDDDLRARYLANLRVQMEHGAAADADPARTTRIVREDRDRPIIKPLQRSRSTINSLGQVAQTAARLHAYRNTLEARGLAVPADEDAYAGVAMDDVPNHLRETLQIIREAPDAELSDMLFATEMRATPGNTRAIAERHLIAGEMRHRGLDTDVDTRAAAAKYAQGGFVDFAPLVKSVMGFLRRNFTSRGDLPEVAYRADPTRAGRIVEENRRAKYLMRDLHRAARQAYGGRPTEEQLRLINDALQSEVDPATLPVVLRAPVIEMRRHLDALSQEMIDGGVVEGETAEIVAANQGTYLRRSYRVYDDPRWPKRIPERVRAAARAFLMNEPAHRRAEAKREAEEAVAARDARRAEFKDARTAYSDALLLADADAWLAEETKRLERDAKRMRERAQVHAGKQDRAARATERARAGLAAVAAQIEGDAEMRGERLARAAERPGAAARTVRSQRSAVGDEIGGFRRRTANRLDRVDGAMEAVSHRQAAAREFGLQDVEREVARREAEIKRRYESRRAKVGDDASTPDAAEIKRLRWVMEDRRRAAREAGIEMGAARRRAKNLESLPDPTPDEVEGTLNVLLDKHEDGVIGALKGGKLGAKDVSTLKHRKDIPVELRELLGEYKDPFVNYARSVAAMAQLIANHQFLTTVRAEGLGVFLHEREVVKDGISYHVPISSEGYKALSPVAGLYTTPEVKRAFEEAVGTTAGPVWLAWYMRVVGTSKLMKTVGNLTTHIRNLLSNTGFAVANGHWRVAMAADAARAILADLGIVEAVSARGDAQWTDARSAEEAVELYLTDRKPLEVRVATASGWTRMTLGRVNYSPDAGRSLYLRLAKLGVVGDGGQSGEIRAVLRDANASPLDRFAGGLKGKVITGVDGVLSLYGSEDDVWKAYAFLNEFARYRRAYPERTVEEVERLAAEIVRDTYPSYSRVPRAVRGLRRVPLIAPFVSFTSEMIRNAKNSVVLAARELRDPATRRIGVERSIGLALAAASVPALALASRMLIGVDDEEDEAVRRLSPPWNRENHLLYYARDENGVPLYVDLSATEPFSYIRRPIGILLRSGNDKAGRIRSELMKPWIGEDIFSGQMFDILRNTQPDGRRVYNPEETPARQALGITAHLWDGMEPGTVQTFRRMYLGTRGEPTSSGRVYNPEEETVAMLTGQRVVHVNPVEALGFSLRRQERRQDDARRILRDAARRHNATDAEIASAYRRMTNALRDVYEDAAADAYAAQVLGVNYSQAYAALESSFSTDETTDIVTGRYTPWYPDENYLADTSLGELEADRRRNLIRRLASEAVAAESGRPPSRGASPPDRPNRRWQQPQRPGLPRRPPQPARRPISPLPSRGAAP